MSPRYLSRLWPVIAALVALLAAAVALDAVARSWEGRPLIVRVEGGSQNAWSDDPTIGGDGDGEGGGGVEAEADAAPPENDAHRQARELARRGQLEPALAAFERAIAAAPSSARLHADAGYWLLVAGRPREAVTELRAARRLDPSQPRIGLNLGIALRRAGELDDAVVVLREVLAAWPGYNAARIALGTALRRQGQLAQAIAVLERATESGGNTLRGRSHLALGRAYLAAGDRDRAATTFARAIEWTPADAEIRLGAAHAYIATGQRQDVARALALLEPAVRMAPDLPVLHSTLGHALELDGSRVEAESAYRTALRLDPTYHVARRRLLRLLLRRGDFVEARAHGDELILVAPDEAEHYLLAGLVAARAGRPGDARELYARANAKRAGGYPEALFNLGLLEKEAGNLEAAVVAYRQAVACEPTYVEALNNLALTLDAAGKPDEGLAAFERAVAIDPTYAPAWFNIGRHHLQAELPDEAAAAFARAVAVRTDYTEAALNLGVARARAGDDQEAVRVYQELLAREPRYPSAWYNLSVSLTRLDLDEEAYAAIRRALEVDPSHLPSLRKRARLEAKRGEAALAEALYREILDREPQDRRARLGLAKLHQRAGRLARCEELAHAVLVDDPDDGRAKRLAADCEAHPTGG